MLRPLYRLADRIRKRQRDRTWPADKAAGRWGEDLAHRHLQRAGLTIVARNWRPKTGGGEVDLIAWEKSVLVFVEVKTRSSDEAAAPDRAIDRNKLQAMRRAARAYLRKYFPKQTEVRFDLVSIVLRDAPDVRHERDAFPVEPPEARTHL